MLGNQTFFFNDLNFLEGIVFCRDWGTLEWRLQTSRFRLKLWFKLFCLNIEKIGILNIVLKILLIFVGCSRPMSLSRKKQEIYKRRFCSAKRIRGAEDRAILVGDHKQLGPVITEHNLCRAYLSMLERCLWEVRCLFFFSPPSGEDWCLNNKPTRFWVSDFSQRMHSLKLTARPWKLMFGKLGSFLGMPCFQVRTASFGEGITPQNQSNIAGSGVFFFEPTKNLRRRNGVWKPPKFSPQFFFKDFWHLRISRLKAKNEELKRVCDEYASKWVGVGLWIIWVSPSWWNDAWEWSSI